MAESKLSYKPLSTVSWTGNNAFAEFQLWRKEVDRILKGPLNDLEEPVKINHVYIWGGAQAELLVEARQSEDATTDVSTYTKILDVLASCLKHATLFREMRETFYSMKQTSTENATAYYSRIMEIHKQCEFPAGSEFLIVDRLIHGCFNESCKRKLMSKTKDAKVKDCLDLLRKYVTLCKLAI